MSDIRLTCDESPLAWPKNVSVDDLKSCSTCGIRITAASPGSLQILTRRQGAGVGDGVNIDESISVGADYRGQRYSYEEAVFHTPGLHIFPGMMAAYPAEYHIHLRTMSAPIRYLTIVVPVSHMTGDDSTKTYFAAAAAKPDPTVSRPTLESLFATAGTKIIQYQGPDIRGRSGDVPMPATVCDSSDERQFLLVLNVARIRASDLERIPREGSLSTDPRDLPAPGVKSNRVVGRERLLRTAVLANPGVLGASPKAVATTKADEPTKEMECKPVRVVNGRDVVDVSGRTVDIKKLLGLVEDEAAATAGKQTQVQFGITFIQMLGALAGLYFVDWLFRKLVWHNCFETSPLLTQSEPIKHLLFLSIAASVAGYSDGILGLVGLA